MPQFSMHLIVGLGNPGAKYARTRHNAGWLVLDEVARRHAIGIDRKEHQALTGRGLIGKQRVLLAKPQTFMNLSGQAASGVLRYNRVDLQNLLVVCDDLNLPVGRLRLRAGGSDGGQNGLKSVAQCLGTQNFARLRFGIGEPQRDEQGERGTVDFVLSTFASDELETVECTVARAADCIECFVQSGIEAAMTAFNRAV
jgi:PTH1 family peptidyl-tRNA hydrolase